MLHDPEEYPKHQAGRGKRDHHDPFAPDVQSEGELEERPRRGPVHQRERASTPQLPAHHGKKALTIGTSAGILASAQGIVITLVNSGLYQQVSKANDANNLSLGLA